MGQQSICLTRNRSLIRIGALTSLVPTALLFASLNILFFVPLLAGIGCLIAGFTRMSPPAKARATRIAAVICLAAAIGPFALTAYADREGYPIKIVLPVGYHGEFSIVKDQSKGQAIDLRDGVWVYEIPPGGKLFVKDGSPLHRWHSETYRSADGQPISAKSLGVTTGRKMTGPNSSIGSTEFDGTTYRWQTVDNP